MPSWNEGADEPRIMSLLRAVGTPGSKDFVAPDESIAVFDNDGTLCHEARHRLGRHRGVHARLRMIVHHDDAARENAFDRNSSIGRLADGPDRYPAVCWGLNRMKNDWKVIHPPLP